MRRLLGITSPITTERMRQDRQRLDKWIWFARVVKSRTLAARLIEAGHVRVNGQRCINPARSLGVGDVLTIALERHIRVLKVLGLGDRRGPFAEARLLFNDLGAEPLVPMLALPA